MPPSRSSFGSSGSGSGSGVGTAAATSKFLQTFRRQKLYGREEEIAQLRAALQVAKKLPSEGEGESTVAIFFVHGESGVGKSALIDTAFWKTRPHNQNGNPPCLLGCGKFEQGPDPTPYAFLLQALRQLVQAMMQCSSSDREMYANMIKETFSPNELSKLVGFIPELTTFLYVESGPGRDDAPFRVSSMPRRYSTDEGAQLKYIIRTFLNKISIPERPIVLYLDDVQWIDDLTLSVVQATLLDNELNHVVFVAAFRTDDVYGSTIIASAELEEDSDPATNQEGESKIDDTHKVVKLMETLKSGLHGSRDVEEIIVKNITADSIQLLLEDVLKTEEGTAELASLFVERTNGGNAYYIYELLTYLENQGLVTFSSMENRWNWDLDRIRNETSVTSNMADILKARIVQLPIADREVLKHCACLGFRFQECLLPVVLRTSAAVLEKQKKQSVDKSGSSIEEPLESEQALDNIDPSSFTENLLNERLLERVGKYLKFVHDKVFEASLELCADDTERTMIHWNLGLSLYNQYFGSDVDSTTSNSKNDDTWKEFVFLCVNRLDSGIKAMEDTEFRLYQDLCKLNHLAARRAADLSAFDDAFVYAKNAMDLLRHIEDSWSTQYNLSLSVHSLYLQMCFCSTSQHQGCLEQTFHLIQKKSRKIEDSMEASLVLLSHYASTTRFEEMISTAHEIFDMVGESMPRDPSEAEARQEFEKVAKLLNNIADEEILEGLPSISKHPLKEFCLRTMDIICYPLNHAGRRNFQLVINSRMVELTLKYGIGSSSAASFAYFGNNMCSEYFDKIRLCGRAVNIAMKLLNKLPITVSECYVRFSTVLVYTWYKPLVTGTEFTLETYRIGMRDGDISAAHLMLIGYCLNYFYSGLSLKPLLDDMSKFIQQMEDYGHKSLLFLNLSLFQTVINISSVKDRPHNVPKRANMRIPGETIFDIGGGSSGALRNRLNWNGKTGLQSDLSYLLQIAIFCRNFPLAVETKTKLLETDKNNSAVIKASYYFGLARVFYICLVSYWQAKKCKKINIVKRQSYLKQAKKYHEMMRHWVVKLGNINLPQKLFILDAEELSLSFKKGKVGDRARELEARVKECYEKAIVASMRTGYTQDAALAAHLASEALPSERDEYWERSRGFYMKWGAIGIVQYVEEQTQNDSTSAYDEDFIEVEGDVNGGTSFRARSRASETVPRASLATSRTSENLDRTSAQSIQLDK